MEQRDAEEVPGDPHGEARTQAHPRPALVAPLHRDDGDREAPSSGDVDQLDVEDDAGDALAREELLRGGAAEALEAALRVRHRAGRNPGRGQGAEGSAEHAPVERLAIAAGAAVGLGAATEGPLVRGPSP